MWCEDRLLERYSEGTPEIEQEFGMDDHPLLRHAEPGLLAELEQRMVPREYEDGELIVERGDAEAGVFLIMSGRVRSSLTTAAGLTRHLAQLTPGTCFGHVYVITGDAHPLTMHTVGHARLRELTREQYDQICELSAELRAAVLNLFMFAIHDDMDRFVGALSNGRVTPMTSS